MAQNKIVLEIFADDSGSLKIVARDAKAAAKSMDQKSKATDKAAKSQEGLNVRQNNYNKLEKGTAQLTANSTKAFSKQAQTLGGTLVPAYATLAANIFALTAAFGALQRAAAFEQLKAGLVTVGAAAGQNLPYIAKQLKEITGAAVSAQEAMSAVALGTSAGFRTDQLEDLTKVAKGASLALGRNLEDALNRLVRGTAKLEPEILDELGIMVRVDDAAQKYAATLGKSVGQLTAFEKRQAFLNETIEQGLIKFGEVEKSVEANPFDQLAASFNDLQKTGFKFLNTVLVPIVNLISKNQFALLGALIIFSKSIANSLLPGIDAAIKKQSKLAANALASAKAVRAEQKAAIAEQAGAIAKKSLPTNAAAVFSGAVRSAKDYKIALDSLDASMESRVNWQKRWDNQAAKLMFTQRALIKEKLTADKSEIAGIDKKIQKTQQEILILREKQRLSREAVAATQVEIAQVKALQKVEMDTIAIRRANAQRMATFRQEFLLGKIAEAGGIKGLGVAIAGAGKQWKKARFDLMDTRLDKIALGFKTATRGARLFGAAMLSAIPAIGTIVMLGGILGPILADMFGKRGLAKEVDEVVDSFKSFRDISVSLSNALASTTSEASKFARTLKTEVGIMGQVEAGFRKIAKAQQEEIGDELVEQLKEQLRLQQNIDNLKNTEGRNSSQMIENLQLAAKFQTQLYEVEARIAKLQAQGSRLDKNSSLAIIRAAMNEINRMAPESRAALSGTVDTLEALADAVSREEIQNLPDLFKNIFTQMENARRADAAITNARLSVTAFDKEINKLANKPTTIFDNIVKQVQALQSEFKAADAVGGIGVKAFLENTPTLVKRLEVIKQKFGDISTDQQALDYLVDVFETAQAKIAPLTGQMEELSVSFKALNEVAGDHPGIMEDALEAERKLLEVRKESLLVRITAAENAGNDVQAAKLKASLLAVETRLTNKQYEQEKINEARAKQQKRILDYETKIVQASQARLKAKIALARVEAQIAASIGNTGVSDITSLQLGVDAEETRMRIIKEQARTKVDTIQVEYDLLQAQLGLEKIKAKNAGASANDLKAYDAYAEALREGRISSLVAAGAQAQLKIRTEEALRQELKRKAVAEAYTLAIEQSNVIAERLKEAGWELEAAGAEYLSTQIRRVQLENELEGLIKGTPEYLKKQLEVQRAITAETNAQLENMQLAADRAANIGGEGIGTAAQFGVDLARAAPDFKGMDTSLQIGKLSELSQGFMEQLKQLGPDGELVASVAQGAFAVSEAWAMAFEEMKENSLTAGTAITAIGSTINAIANIQAASSSSRIASMDREIEAEKKRDGKSRESQQKLQALEKKKEAMKRKAFEQDKKMKIASAVSSTALAIANALTTNPFIPMGPIAASIAAAMGAAQIAVIAGTSYNGGGNANTSAGPTSLSIGSRSNSVDLASSNSAAGELAFMRGERGLGNTGANNFIPTGAFAGVETRASGGSTGYIVGEQGPELFIPERPGNIIPADETEKVSASTGNVSFTINAIDAAGVEDVLRSQRGNIIGMIREAANDHGEYFLETVSTQEDNVRL